MQALVRSNVVQFGNGVAPMMFAHGFGCDQQMWRFVAPAFADSHKVVLFDHVGCGKSDLKAYDEQRHSSLPGYAQDVLDILEAAQLNNVVFVGHSVSAMVGILAAIQAPERFSRLVLLGPSPRYLNEAPGYFGGFERQDIEGLLDMIETNMLGWASFLAPMVMGASNPSDLTDELKQSFCAVDPYITRRFAQATFLGDNRADLPLLKVPSMVVQMADDAIAPRKVGEYVHRHTPHSRLAVIEGSGHCAHMTHPQETVSLIRAFLAET